MNHHLKSRRSLNRHAGSQSGVAVVVLLYGLSVFSVLSLTALRDAELERTLQTADHPDLHVVLYAGGANSPTMIGRSEEHTSELQSPCNLVCRLLLEKKKQIMNLMQQKQESRLYV